MTFIILIYNQVLIILAALSYQDITLLCYYFICFKSIPHQVPET